MPGDLLGGVTLEVRRCRDAARARARRPRAPRTGAAGAALRACRSRQAVLQRARRVLAGEHAPRRVEQVLEQLRLPRVPDLRARAADVGDGQQVERDQAPLGADLARECRDDRGIGDVLLLRGRRHRQVLLDQPGDELGVLGGQPVLAAEAARVACAERRMVAAAALGDVVEQRRRRRAPPCARSRRSAASTADTRARAASR